MYAPEEHDLPNDEDFADCFIVETDDEYFDCTDEGSEDADSSDLDSYDDIDDSSDDVVSDESSDRDNDKPDDGVIHLSRRIP